jgi:hypothetical protein
MAPIQPDFPLSRSIETEAGKWMEYSGIRYLHRKDGGAGENRTHAPSDE